MSEDPSGHPASPRRLAELIARGFTVALSRGQRQRRFTACTPPGFGYLHLRHDLGMPHKVRIPQSPPRMARNSRRAPTFEASLELTHRSWPWLLALLGRLSIKATRRTCRGSQTRALWRLSPPPCSPCLPRLRPACLRPLTCLFVFCCCCICVLNCFSRCARVGPGCCGAVVPQARGTETAIAAAQ